MVVPEARQATRSYPWLLRINLPGMQIKHCWLLFSLVDLAQSPAGDRIRKQPEVATPCNGQAGADPL
jgi:hypothetical protein